MDQNRDLEELEEELTSSLATRVTALRAAAFRLCKKRRKLPYPFFWSLLHGEISEIRQERARERTRRRVEDGIVE